MADAKKYNLALCRFPGQGVECSGGVSWLMRTIIEMKREQAEPEGHVGRILDVVVSETPITMGRNFAVKKSLEAGCDYILMIDSDMVPDYLVDVDPMAWPFWSIAWAFMMSRRADEEQERESIWDACSSNPGWNGPAFEEEMFKQFPPATIAAPYCGPPPIEYCYVFKWKSHETGSPDPSFKLEMIEREDAAARSGIEEVAALPTGLILYDARVFKRMQDIAIETDYRHPRPWFDYEYKDLEQTEKGSTEDVFQTRNAAMLGMPQYCAWDCWAMHVKQKGVQKPHSLTSDMVHEFLAGAVASGRRSNERLRFQQRPASLNGVVAKIDPPWTVDDARKVQDSLEV